MSGVTLMKHLLRGQSERVADAPDLVLHWPGIEQLAALRPRGNGVWVSH